MKKKRRMEVVSSNKHPKLRRNLLRNQPKNQRRLLGKLPWSLMINLSLLRRKNQLQLLPKERNLFPCRRSQDLLALWKHRRNSRTLLWKFKITQQLGKDVEPLVLLLTKEIKMMTTMTTASRVAIMLKFQRLQQAVQVEANSLRKLWKTMESYPKLLRKTTAIMRTQLLEVELKWVFEERERNPLIQDNHLQVKIAKEKLEHLLQQT